MEHTERFYASKESHEKPAIDFFRDNTLIKYVVKAVPLEKVQAGLPIDVTFISHSAYQKVLSLWHQHWDEFRIRERRLNG